MKNLPKSVEAIKAKLESGWMGLGDEELRRMRAFVKVWEPDWTEWRDKEHRPSEEATPRPKGFQSDGVSAR